MYFINALEIFPKFYIFAKDISITIPDSQPQKSTTSADAKDADFSETVQSQWLLVSVRFFGTGSHLGHAAQFFQNSLLWMTKLLGQTVLRVFICQQVTLSPSTSCYHYINRWNISQKNIQGLRVYINEKLLTNSTQQHTLEFGVNYHLQSSWQWLDLGRHYITLILHRVAGWIINVIFK